MISERSKAPVRSISASARSTRSRGGRRAVQADVDVGRRRLGRLAHHGLDGQVGHARRPVDERLRPDEGQGVPPPLAAQRLPRHQAAGPPLTVGPVQRERLVGLDDRRVGRRARLDLAHGPAVDVVAGGAQQRPRQAAWPVSFHSCGPPGSTADEPAAGRASPARARRRRERQPADDAAGDAERAQRGRRPGRAGGLGVGSCSRCRRCSSDEGDAQADRYGDRQAGDPAAGPEPAVQRAPAPASVPISKRPADAGDGEPPARPGAAVPRSIASPGRAGSAACTASPSGMAARSAARVSRALPAAARPRRVGRSARPPARRRRPAARPASPTVSR